MVWVIDELAERATDAHGSPQRSRLDDLEPSSATRSLGLPSIGEAVDVPGVEEVRVVGVELEAVAACALDEDLAADPLVEDRGQEPVFVEVDLQVPVLTDAGCRPRPAGAPRRAGRPRGRRPGSRRRGPWPEDGPSAPLGLEGDGVPSGGPGHRGTGGRVDLDHVLALLRQRVADDDGVGEPGGVDRLGQSGERCAGDLLGDPPDLGRARPASS